MCMYIIFMILVQNYENAIHAHNYRLFCKGLFLIILFQLYDTKGGLFGGNFYSGWVSLTPNLRIGRRANPIFI